MDYASSKGENTNDNSALSSHNLLEAALYANPERSDGSDSRYHNALHRNEKSQRCSGFFSPHFHPLSVLE